MGWNMKKHSEVVAGIGKLKTSSGLDSEWFKAQMRLNHLTTRGLGERVGLHYSAIGRMTNGQQGMKSEDVAMFARAFGMPVEEVLRRTGAVVLATAAPGKVVVAGWLDAEGIGHADGLVGPRLVDGPVGGHRSLQALRGQGGGQRWMAFLLRRRSGRASRGGGPAVCRAAAGGCQGEWAADAALGDQGLCGRRVEPGPVRRICC